MVAGADKTGQRARLRQVGGAPADLVSSANRTRGSGSGQYSDCEIGGDDVRSAIGVGGGSGARDRQESHPGAALTKACRHAEARAVWEAKAG